MTRPDLRKGGTRLRQNQSSTVRNAVLLLRGLRLPFVRDELDGRNLTLSRCFSSPIVFFCATRSLFRASSGTKCALPRAPVHTLFSVRMRRQFSLNWDSTEPRPWWVHLDPPSPTPFPDASSSNVASISTTSNIFHLEWLRISLTREGFPVESFEKMNLGSILNRLKIKRSIFYIYIYIKYLESFEKNKTINFFIFIYKYIVYIYIYIYLYKFYIFVIYIWLFFSL